MNVLAIDPSTTRIGWASGTSRTELVDYGAIEPARPTADWELRLESMRAGVYEVLARIDPHCIVIETPSGKTHRRIGHASGLPIYGAAVGAVLEICWRYRVRRIAVRIIYARENVWTRGISKAIRQRCVASEFSQYDPAADRGGDISDAIALMQWAFDQTNIDELVADAGRRA